MEKFITLTHLKKALQSLIVKFSRETESLSQELGSLSQVAKTGDYNDLNYTPEIPANISDLNNDIGCITEETDPTVPEWAKQPNKPTYTATEVGALSDTTDLSIYMIKDTDYVTAGQRSGTIVGYKATAEGSNTKASGDASHAEGNHATASGDFSHAEGMWTEAQGSSQHVFGACNIIDTAGSKIKRGTYIEIVGNGTTDYNRSNARTLDWSGNEWLAGKLTLGSAPTENMDAATKQYVDTAITTYSLSISNNIITLTGSDNSTSTITLPIYNGGVSN